MFLIRTINVEKMLKYDKNLIEDGVNMKRLTKKAKIVIGTVGLALLLLAILLIINIISKKDNSKVDEQEPKNEIKEELPIKKLQIMDLNSNSRSYAVMINNHSSARAHHAGLQDAYLIYEIIVEGGLTRYMAIFKDQDTAKIGSVRSSRHYFLDYAMENDAIYVHWGWSPQAQNDISEYKINNINGLTWEGTYFYRDKSLNVSSEHTGFTTMEMLKKGASRLGYRTTSNEQPLLNYEVDEIDNSNLATIPATTVTIKYSSSVTDKYVYDETNKVYKRYVNNKEHVDDVTKKQYTFKNIITYQVANSSIKGDNKGRQDIANIGKGSGYYISNGVAVKINWEKTSRQSKTIYTYEDGTPLKVNDGNTFIQIQPKNQTLKIEGSSNE